MKAIFVVMNTTQVIVKIRPEKIGPVRDLNPGSLLFRCSALPTELTNQLGAGHYVSS